MKRLLLTAGIAMIFACGATESSGQAIMQWWNPLTGVGVADTLVNTDSAFLTTRTKEPGTMAVQLDIKYISGAPRGTIVLEASIDHETTPVKWVTIPSTTGANDTLTSADKTLGYVIPANYLHYRWNLHQTGTARAVPKAYSFTHPPFCR